MSPEGSCILFDIRVTHSNALLTDCLSSSCVCTLLRLAVPHLPYVNLLPTSSELTTPLLFTPQERELISGSNLDHAASDREKLWRAEWKAAKVVVCKGELGGLREAFNW